MRLKGLFRILTVLLLIILSVTTWQVFYHSSFRLFLGMEMIVVITAIYLIIFYRSIIKPLQVIGDGMDLLKEQDFTSRLRKVGQPEADRIVGVFNKMMEQLKNERLRLREQNHFLDLLINASPMSVIILDLDRQIRSVNPAGCRMFGLQSEGAAMGKCLAGIDSPLAAELLRIEAGQSQTIRLSDANIYKCTHSSFIDKGFRHSFYLVESLTEEVFKAEKKAYEKVIRMIAHEVNNTTAGITSILDTLENTFRRTGADEDLTGVIQVAIERCYSMSRFITNFADVVRIPVPQLREQELNALVVSCKRFMENVCRNRNIQISMELSEVSPIVRVDNLLFEQVLVNIIKNAAESIGSGGQIHIRTAHHPVCLEIADTGKGISKETEAKLFSPFFSTKPNGQGLGLLFIREVLLKHGCAFSLRTWPDGLTRFKIILEKQG
ncbi:MAG: PAS domain-containing protein [Tannerellaceae bacterium]|jgi:nitrogen fixation/metabolism regulation signal transduction histidine kinase|nr:PAS domain-containing protein [Tannerellaceae bacterium]